MIKKRFGARLSLKRRRSIAGYIFVSPFMVGFAAFMLFSLIFSLQLSLGKRIGTIGFDTKFVGFGNYIELFTEDIKFVPAFLETIQRTFIWTPFIIIVALVLGILLNRNLHGKGFFRLIFFLPVLLGGGYAMQHVSGAADVLALPENVQAFITDSLSMQLGEFLNNLLKQVLSGIWSTGVPIVIFLSGLQGIPESYYEASRIDGAGGLAQFWKITMPLLSPVILLNVVYTVIENFRSTSNSIAYLIVQTAFQSNPPRYEKGAAMGWIYFLVVLIFVGFIFLISRAMVNYEK